MAIRVLGSYAPNRTWWARYWASMQGLVVMLALNRWIDRNALTQPAAIEVVGLAGLLARCLGQMSGQLPIASLMGVAYPLMVIGHHETTRGLLARALEPASAPRHLGWLVRWFLLRNFATLPGQLVLSGELVAALGYQAWLHDLQQKLRGDRHPATLHALHELGALCAQMGQCDIAMAYWHQELEMRSASQAPRHADILHVRSAMAEVLCELGRLSEAEEHEAFVVDAYQRARSKGPAVVELRAHLRLLLTRIRTGKITESTHLELEFLMKWQKDACFDVFEKLAANTVPPFLELNAWNVRSGTSAIARELIEQIFIAPDAVSGDPDLIRALLACAAASREQSDIETAQDIELRVLEALSVPAWRLGRFTHRGWLKSASLVRTQFDKLSTFWRGVVSSRLAYSVIRGELSVWRRLQLGNEILVRWTADAALTVESARVVNAVDQISRAGLDELELERQGARGWLASGFQAFHEAWFKLCERIAPDQIVGAIAPLHGMESWIFCIGPGLPSERDETPLARQEYIDARRRMTGIRLGTGGGSIAAALARIDITDGVEQADPQERFRAARAMLAAEDRAFAAAEWVGATSIERLTRIGGAHSVVLLCSIGDRLRAFILRSGERLRPMDLGPVSALRIDVSQYAGSYRAANTGLLRDVLDRQRLVPTSLEPATHLPTHMMLDLVKRVSELVWAPLAAVLGHTSRCDLVTGPGLHALPFALGQPQELDVRRFCGLAAYLRLRGHSADGNDGSAAYVAAQPEGLEVFVDDAISTDMPIPFVQVEAALTGFVFTQASGGVLTSTVRPARELDGRIELKSWIQIATHGMAFEELTGGISGARGPRDRHGVICLDAVVGLQLDGATVLNLRGDMREVFVSACAAGLVGSAETGDPIGVVSSLQLQGVQTVVACLAPVPDFLMPLLVGAYWEARLQGLWPKAALATAKEQLVARSWSRNFVKGARSAYKQGMQQVLRAICVQGEMPLHADRRIHLFRTVAGWPLSDEARASWFPGCFEANLMALCRSFETAVCMDPIASEALIDEVLHRMFDEENIGWPLELRDAVAHLNVFTCHFGL